MFGGVPCFQHAERTKLRECANVCIDLEWHLVSSDNEGAPQSGGGKTSLAPPRTPNQSATSQRGLVVQFPVYQFHRLANEGPHVPVADPFR